MVNFNELKELIEYNPDTGHFIRLISRGNAKLGSRAGSLHPDGYRQIEFRGLKIKEHRLAFLFMEGEMLPDDVFVDHINTIKDDNRWCNLRVATRSQNGMNRGKNKNNSSGHKNICIWTDKKGTTYYRVKVSKNRKEFVKVFDITKFNLKDVIKFRDELIAELHGEFSRK